jgi:hypothetical protein
MQPLALPAFLEGDGLAADLLSDIAKALFEAAARLLASELMGYVNDDRPRHVRLLTAGPMW